MFHFEFGNIRKQSTVIDKCLHLLELELAAHTTFI